MRTRVYGYPYFASWAIFFLTDNLLDALSRFPYRVSNLLLCPLRVLRAQFLILSSRLYCALSDDLGSALPLRTLDLNGLLCCARRRPAA